MASFQINPGDQTPSDTTITNYPHAFPLENLNLDLPQCSRETLDDYYFIAYPIAETGNSCVFLAIRRPGIREPQAQPPRREDTKRYVIKVQRVAAFDNSNLTEESGILHMLTRCTDGAGRHHIVPLAKRDNSNPVMWLATLFINGPTFEQVVNEFDGKMPLVMAYHFFISAIKVLNWCHELAPEKPFRLVHQDFHLANWILDVSNIPSSPPDSIMTASQLQAYLPRLRLLDFGRATINADDDDDADTAIGGERYKDINGFSRIIGQLFGECFYVPTPDNEWLNSVYYDTDGPKLRSLGQTPLCLTSLQQKYEEYAQYRLGQISVEEVQQIVSACMRANPVLPSYRQMRGSFDAVMEGYEVVGSGSEDDLGQKNSLS